MDREILSKLPTLLRHKLQSKMAHFAALDGAVRTSIKKIYEINTALHKCFILCIRLFIMKAFVVIEIVRHRRCTPLLGDMEYLGTHQNENQINADGS